MNIESLKRQLDSRTDLQHLLFRRGFVVSKNVIDGLDAFPFYGNWKHTEVCGFNFYVHKDNHLHFVYKENCTVCLIGHSYNPFTMGCDEESQLDYIAEAFETPFFQYRINELTGLFLLCWIETKTGKFHFQADCSGMQSQYHGILPDGNFIITSHPQIAADLFNLHFDEGVKEVTDYKWYPRLLGSFLPGDLCQYRVLSRIVPNIGYTYYDGQTDHERFYPLKELEIAEEVEDYNAVIMRGAEILRNSMQLVVKKWKKPSISLTGGIDSQTTFAAANGVYDKISAFSYLSNHQESIDITAARKTAAAFGVPYELYNIPESADGIADYKIK